MGGGGWVEVGGWRRVVGGSNPHRWVDEGGWRWVGGESNPHRWVEEGGWRWVGGGGWVVGLFRIGGWVQGWKMGWNLESNPHRWEGIRGEGTRGAKIAAPDS